MKKLIPIVISSFAILTAAHASPATLVFSGPLTIRLTASTQNYIEKTVLSNQTTTATSTNKHLLLKSAVTNSMIDDAYLLRLLTNAFNMTFPSKAQLSTDGNKIYVTDSTGTNVVLDVSSVFTITNNTLLYTFTDNRTLRTVGAVTTVHGVGAGVNNASLSLTFDDSQVTTSDGTHSTFTFGGISTDSYNKNDATAKEHDVVTAEVWGWGYIKQTNQVSTLHGHVMETTSGVTGP